MQTLLDIAVKNGSDAITGLIDEAASGNPEIRLGYARTITGINYKTLVRTANPTVGFRNANEGVAGTKATYENRLVETFILNPRWQADKAVADRYEDGAEALLAMEAEAHFNAAVAAICRQMYYGTGTGGDAKGFPGLVQSYDNVNMVVDAGGTTDNTGSSVWLVKFGPKYCGWVWGNDGQMELSEVDLRDVSDGTNSFTGYHQELTAYSGFQVGNVKAVARIKKVTEDSTKGLSDSLISKALAKFPVGIIPDVIFCSRRSLFQLQASRTATNATGAPAPVPTEAFGIPVVATDSILNTEALTL